MRDFRSKGSQTIRATPDYFVPGDRKLGQRDLLASTTDGSRFPENRNPLQSFFSFFLSRALSGA